MTRKIVLPLVVVVLALAIIGAGYFALRSLNLGSMPQHQTPDTQANNNQNGAPEPTSTIPPGQLKIDDITLGDGDVATPGKTVTVNYKGTLEDGTVFDSSYDRGTPFSFKLGAGEVIQGWDIGVAGMKVGGKRKLTIPPDLGYGAQGAGSVIPPYATLIFEVELLKVE